MTQEDLQVFCSEFKAGVFIRKNDKDLTLGPHYESKTSEPITAPLKTLDDVLLWKPGEDEFNVAMEPLASRTTNDNHPKTLVCHDMMGGYVDDRFVQGVPKVDCYRFYHWQYLDSFIYFSHYFVTIPPPCWTNAAHKNAVPMFGTVITEWKDGAGRCEQVFQSEEAYKIFANKLVDICKYYRFDGWLINIENQIKVEHMPQLVDFVRYLRKKMSSEIPGSKVIWYDSVIIDGTLKWQDMLNSNNRVFFDGSDGIFLNYTWTEAKLKESVKNAGDRISDVYVGVDIFGRNCFGGGGWNTYKAMEVIRPNNLSAAIFAPGWVYEKFDHSDLILNQNKFWEDQLHTFLYTHGVTSLPFVSNFCRGYGDFGFKFGQKVMQKMWCNLSAQQIQPTYNNKQFTNETKQCMSHDTTNGFSGGGCLLLTGSFETENTQTFKIFDTGFESKTPLLVSIVTRADAGCDGFLYFDVSGGTRVYFVTSGDTKDLSQKVMTEYGAHYSVQCNDDTLIASLEDSDCEAYTPVCSSCDKHIQDIMCGQDSSKADLGGWTMRNYLLPKEAIPDGAKVTLIGMKCIKTSDSTPGAFYNIRVGGVKIFDPACLKDHTQQVKDILCENIIWREPNQPKDQLSLSITLKWTYPIQALHYDIFCSGVTLDPNAPRAIDPSKTVFIGRSHTNLFRVCHMEVPRPTEGHEGHLKFFIQPTTKAGISATFDKISCYAFTYTS